MVDGQQFKVIRDLSSIVFYFFLSPRCEDFHFVIPTLYFFCCMIFFYLDIWFQMKIYTIYESINKRYIAFLCMLLKKFEIFMNR